MRSSLVIRSSDCQCQSLNSPGFDPGILQLRGIWGAAAESVNKRNFKIPPYKQQIFVTPSVLIVQKTNTGTSVQQILN